MKNKKVVVLSKNKAFIQKINSDSTAFHFVRSDSIIESWIKHPQTIDFDAFVIDDDSFPIEKLAIKQLLVSAYKIPILYILNHPKGKIALDGVAFLENPSKEKIQEMLLKLFEEPEKKKQIIGLWEWDFQTGEIAFDLDYYNMLGYKNMTTQADIPFSSYGAWMQFVCRKDRGKIEEKIKRLINKEIEEVNFTFSMHNAKGEFIELLSKNKIIKKDFDGKPTRMRGTNKIILKQKNGNR